MSGLSGQAEITITKADGRQFKQVIKNDIVPALYAELVAQMIGGDLFADHVPDTVKVFLSGGGTLTKTVTPKAVGALTSAYIEYNIGGPFLGSTFSGGSGGFVNKVQLLDGTTACAEATSDGSGTGTTFTAGSNVLSANTVDDNDTVACTYRLQFQSYTGGLQPLYARNLMQTIAEGGTEGKYSLDIANFWVTDADGGNLGSGTLEDTTHSEALTSTSTDTAYTIACQVFFAKVASEPVGYKVFTSGGGEQGDPGVLIVHNSLTGEPAHPGDDNDQRLNAFVNNDNIVLPIRIVLNRLTSTPVS